MIATAVETAVEFDARELVKDIEIKVKITHARTVVWRLKLAAWLMRVAEHVGGISILVVEEKYCDESD